MSCEQLLAADHPIPSQADRESQHIHLRAVPTAASEARRFARDAASVLDDDRLYDLMVLTSELVTNAVLHARTPLEVGVTVTAEAVVVCVGDADDAHPMHQPPSDGRESGRGITLVRELADEWGVLPADARSGKAVWFLVRRQVGQAVGAGV